MAQIAEQYGKVLYELQISKTDVECMHDILVRVPQLLEVLDNPVVTKETKHEIVEKIFPKSLHNFMKTVSDHRRTEQIGKILEVWKKYILREENILAATLFCVHAPSEEQRMQVENFVKETFGSKGVELTVKYQPDLIGGFILRVGDREFDWSLQGRIRQLEQRLVRR